MLLTSQESVPAAPSTTATGRHEGRACIGEQQIEPPVVIRRPPGFLCFLAYPKNPAHRLWKPPVGLVTPARLCCARGWSTAASSEMPKSVSFSRPPPLYRKLPGLMSRCTTPKSAPRTTHHHRQAAAGGSGPDLDPRPAAVALLQRVQQGRSWHDNAAAAAHVPCS